MSKIYTASMLRRPASPRSDKLKAVNGGSSSSSHSSSSSSSIVPAAADSVFWKYFGLDENGDLYVKPKEDEEPRSLWTYGNLAAGGGIQSDEEPSPSPSEGSSVTWDQRYPSTGERIAIISIDGQDINVYAPGALTEGTDYLSPANVQSRIDAAVNPISALIPAAASAQNQLADKAFVNSSIASNTGVFQGTFSSTSQLPSTGVNTNDYAFVTTQDEHGQAVYNRYKYNGTQWVFEYALNNSSFTAAQWSAINSGITAQKVSGYDALVSNVQADWNATTGLAVILNKPSSLPASDVYPWAKAASKPSYSFSEIDEKPSTLSGYGITDAKFSSAGSGVTDKVRITLGGTSNDVLTQHQSLSAYLTSEAAAQAYQTKLNATTNMLDPTYIAANSTHRWWTDDLAATLSGKADASNLADYLPLTDFRFDILCKSSLGSDTDMNTVYDPSFADLTGHFRYYAYVGATPWPPVSGTQSTAGVHGFPTSSNANALLTIDTYSDNDTCSLYQIGLSNNGNIYFRNGVSYKANGSWSDPFGGNGNWNRLLWEDHNGDVSINGDIVLKKGEGLWLDTNKNYTTSAYITRGNSASDYYLYINSGHDGSDREANLYVTCGDFIVNGWSLQPANNISANLGHSNNRWHDLYLSHHARISGDIILEAGGSIKFNGESPSSGQANPHIYMVGGTGNNRYDLAIYNGGFNIYHYAALHCFQGGNVTPYDTATQDIGTSSLKWRDLYLSRDAYVNSIKIGPVTIYYDSTNKCLRVIGTDNGTTIGFCCDGQVAAGGIYSNS